MGISYPHIGSIRLPKYSPYKKVDNSSTNNVENICSNQCSPRKKWKDYQQCLRIIFYESSIEDNQFIAT